MTDSSPWWHATSVFDTPRTARFRSGGTSERQSSVAIQRRGSNRHPAGGLVGEGGSQLRMRRLCESAPIGPAGGRGGGEQSVSVRMGGGLKQGRGIADFCDAAQVHDGDAIGDVPHDGEVVGDEKNGDAKPALDIHGSNRIRVTGLNLQSLQSDRLYLTSPRISARPEYLLERAVLRRRGPPSDPLKCDVYA
jgi:hypothetical protein